MAASKAGFMKDAFILFAITLVSGICLGFVYEITKGPIEQATIAANNATYQAVLPAASQFDAVEGSEEQAAVLNASGELSKYGNVGVESVLEGTDASGNPVGYVLNTYSNDSYGGLVSLSVGVDMEGTIVGVGIREISDTPGLGLKAQDAEYTDQFVGKNVHALTVTNSGSAAETEINAISGATVTSEATTNAVNAALYYLHNYLE